MLYSYHPSSNSGKYKNKDNVIEEVDSKGNHHIRFEPTSAFETPASIEALCKTYNDAIKEDRIDPLILISKFILDFLSIHPFNERNAAEGIA